jgi:hypothetical protein
VTNGAQASCLRFAGILPAQKKMRAGCSRTADKDVGAPGKAIHEKHTKRTISSWISWIIVSAAEGKVNPDRDNNQMSYFPKKLNER